MRHSRVGRTIAWLSGLLKGNLTARWPAFARCFDAIGGLCYYRPSDWARPCMCRILAHRSSAERCGMARKVQAMRGTALRCRGWRQEGLLRLLENVLEVGERPEEL